MTIKPLVAGNWKMNGLSAALAEFAVMNDRYGVDVAGKVDMMICPPATLLAAMSQTGGTIAIGGQDCHTQESGAHTGDLSAEMLVDAGASAIIVGHSERRADHGETDAVVNAKAQAAQRAGAVAIICVGETKEQREAGDAVNVVISQLKGSIPQGSTAEAVIIAYEPVWAIGTGLTPTADDVADMHAAIRAALSDMLGATGNEMRILYGGSVKPANAVELMGVANVNGALVGGASLKADDLFGIAAAYAG